MSLLILLLIFTAEWGAYVLLKGKNYNTRQLARFFVVSFILCSLAYIVLISNELTNTYDGLWKGSYDIGYNWVISIGRWFWPTIGRLRENYSPEPFTSMLSLACHVCGGIIVAYIFGLKDSFKGYIVVLLTVVNTAVCSFLSYRYMSPVFAFAYLFVIIGIWQLRECTVRSLIISIVMFTLSLGCYQMNIGCACVLIILLTVWYLQKECENKKIIKFFCFSAISMISSFIIYKIIWNISLKTNHLVTADYKDADKITPLLVIKSFPRTFVKTYTTFADFFLKDDLKQNIYENTYIFKVGVFAFFILAFAHVISAAFSKGRKRAVFVLLLFMVLPAAANAALILAPGSNDFQIQMTLPMTVLLPLLLCIVDVGDIKEELLKKIEKIYPLVFTLLLIGNFLMISVDQHAMLTGRRAVLSILNIISSDIDHDSLNGKKCVFIGRPSENPMFANDEVWDRANDYAKYGKIWLDNYCSTRSYAGFIRESGVLMPQENDFDLCQEIERSTEVKDMPVFPHNGYKKEINGVIVIKLADPE